MFLSFVLKPGRRTQLKLEGVNDNENHLMIYVIS